MMCKKKDKDDFLDRFINYLVIYFGRFRRKKYL